MTEPAHLPEPTSDERMLAALAHFSGILVSLIIYAVQKDKSRYVRFQAVQALAFDLITMLAMFVMVGCMLGVMFTGMVGTLFAGLNSAASPENVSWLLLSSTLLPVGMVACVSPFSILLFFIRIVATISVLNGNNFHYPWLGTRVEQFLTD